jgi:hypothetical protein
MRAPWDEMARSERFELPTLGFEVRCSIQLSYERINVFNRLGSESEQPKNTFDNSDYQSWLDGARATRKIATYRAGPRAHPGNSRSISRRRPTALVVKRTIEGQSATARRL